MHIIKLELLLIILLCGIIFAGMELLENSNANSLEYQQGYEDFPNDTIYKECLPYSSDADILFNIEYIKSCDLYVRGWNAASKDHHESELKDQQEQNVLEFEIKKNELNDLINSKINESD